MAELTSRVAGIVAGTTVCPCATHSAATTSIAARWGSAIGRRAGVWAAFPSRVSANSPPRSSTETVV